jgi:hypothetical protein
MKKLIVIFFLFIISLTPALAQDKNYCRDKESWKEWDELVQKYPHNMDIQMLHAVRIGFCKKGENGSISFETAREVFNHLHESVYKKAKTEQNQWLKNKQL